MVETAVAVAAAKAVAAVAWGWGRVRVGEKKCWREEEALHNGSNLGNFEFKCLNLRPIFWSQNRSQIDFYFVKLSV